MNFNTLLIVRTISFVCLSLLLPSKALASHTIASSAFSKTGQVKHKALSEISGLAASQRQSKIYWALNDGGNGRFLYALNTQGKVLTKVKIKGVKNRDWEDLASFRLDGKPYLMIAEIGDNHALYKHYRLHFIREPKAKHFDGNKTLNLKPEWSIDFTYENGARDSESAAVDIVNKRIILLSKRDKVPQLYHLPLLKNPTQTSFVAKHLGNLEHSLKEKPENIINLKHRKFNGNPTAMDISVDGMMAAVLTYEHLFLFKRSVSTTSSRDLFTNPPIKIKLPKLKQAEAVSFDKKGKTLFVTTEKLPAPLYEINLKKLPTF